MKPVIIKHNLSLVVIMTALKNANIKLPFQPYHATKELIQMVAFAPDWTTFDLEFRPDTIVIMPTSTDTDGYSTRFDEAVKAIIEAISAMLKG